MLGGGTDIAMESSSLFDQVDFVHRVTVQDKNNVFVIPLRTNNKRTGSRGKWVPKRHADIDLGITNCPERSGAVAASLKTATEYWCKNVIPFLKKGRADSYLRAAAVCVARCCCNSAAAVLAPGVITQFERGFVPDAAVEKILKYAADNLGKDSGATTSSPEMGEEALEAITTAVYRIYKKGGSDSSKKFGSVIAFVLMWSRVADWYAAHPVHKVRDCKLSCIRATHNDVHVHPADSTLLYPINTDASVIIEDYILKLLAELVLSPHIHIEWKIDMCRFISKDGPRMLSAFEKDINSAVADIFAADGDTTSCEYGSAPISECKDLFGPRYNPTRLQPCAANFWDFCRGDNPPSDVRYAMLFNEPSSHPSLASGAGAFGTYYGDCALMKGHHRSVTSSALANLLRVENCVGLSTRRWREEGTVLCFNFCPLTCALAPAGFGELRARSMPKGFWIKTIQRAIVGSRCRNRHKADKSCRSSDLLADSGNISLMTVAFGCNDMMQELSGVACFNLAVNYHESVFVNAPGSDRLYRSQTVVSHTFPTL